MSNHIADTNGAHSPALSVLVTESNTQGVRTADIEAIAALLDAPLGLAIGAVRIAQRATATTVSVARPIVGFALRPPLLPRRLWPQSVLDSLSNRGSDARHSVEREVSALADTLIPAVLDAVLRRIDLAGIAHTVIDDIDLSRIIRESSTSMASESVVGVRMQGIEADDRINRIVDRLLLRRSERNTLPSVDVRDP